MALDPNAIRALAEALAAEFGPSAGASSSASTGGGGGGGSLGDGVYSTIDEAVNAARRAFFAYDRMGLGVRHTIVAAMRDVCRREGRALAEFAHSETGLGRIEDKVIKNQVVTEHTPGPEILEPLARSGDRGLMLTEPAPFGVLGAITPVTNPTSTIICNAIGMISAGNSVVFNVHPSAKRVSMHSIQILNRAIVGAGGPPDLLTCIAEPTIKSAGELMHHPLVRLLVVTGGGGVVRAAMNSGKRAICAGPGNPPTVVDATADIDKAARDIVLGHSFDNNVICVDEKECIVVDSVADPLIAAMQRNGAVLLPKSDLKRLEKVIFKEMAGPRGHAKLNADLVGKDASVILGHLGIKAGLEARCVIVEVDNDHPLIWTEQMMPVLPVTRTPNVDAAIELAVAAEGGCFHTASMHSHDLRALSKMARECNCSIFVKNGRCVSGLGAGGEGWTSFTIASPTGEGLTNALSFSRWRRCTMVDHFRIV
jgi:acyl-CoA reductase-like NAD-dependent aldehyde dehydrogenase